MNEKVKIEEKNNWWLFCYSYMSIAELACREMINQKYHWFKHKERDFGPKAFSVANLYIPMIYNLKHSIEIFLKYFIIVIDDEFPEIGKNGHSIEKYLKLFQNKYKVEKINKFVKKIYKKNSEKRYLYTYEQNSKLQVADTEADFSEEWMKNIIEISLKYFYCQDLKNKISNFNLRDISNDGFRYPKNKLNIDLDYYNIVREIKVDDVKTILKDIYELKNAFRSLAFLIDAYHEFK